ncbi:MAG: YigZ family protein [Lachnospiraceae bacterium]
MNQLIKFLYKGGSGEIEEKKSRFIATTLPVSSQEEALEFIEKTKKHYWDARHNCFAYVVGEHHEIQRFSDDGEPGGTAGKPMLDVLLGEDIHNMAVVVTRYFGGTLLGTGGLVRAYSRAVKEGLANSVILEKQSGKRYGLQTDYSDVGKIQYLLAGSHIAVLSEDYGADVRFEILLPTQLDKSMKEELVNATNGRIRMTEIGSCHFAIHKKEVLLL